MVPLAFTRRQPGPADVTIQIAYVGICHSDYHTVLNEWGGTAYPVVPGCDLGWLRRRARPCPYLQLIPT
jgi:uncharacterized zinc-type alcohol dehydrogenase-like protein